MDAGLGPMAGEAYVLCAGRGDAPPGPQGRMRAWCLAALDLLWAGSEAGAVRPDICELCCRRVLSFMHAAGLAGWAGMLEGWTQGAVTDALRESVVSLAVMRSRA
jgi:hypothetical protein